MAKELEAAIGCQYNILLADLKEQEDIDRILESKELAGSIAWARHNMKDVVSKLEEAARL